MSAATADAPVAVESNVSELFPETKRVDDDVVMKAILSAKGEKTRAEIADSLGIKLSTFGQKVTKIRGVLKKHAEKLIAEKKPLPSYIADTSWLKMKDARKGSSGRNAGEKTLSAVEELFKDNSPNVDIEDESLAD